MVRTLLEACRAAGDSEGASRLQAVVERFGLIAEVPVAVAILQGSEWRSEIGMEIRDRSQRGRRWGCPEAMDRASPTDGLRTTFSCVTMDLRSEQNAQGV